MKKRKCPCCHKDISRRKEIIEIPPQDINFSYAFPVYRLNKFEKLKIEFIGVLISCDI